MNAVTKRLRMGWSVDKSLSTPVKATVPKTITYEGRTKTIKQWSDELGIPRVTIESRLKKGLDIVKVLSKTQLRTNK